MNILILLEETEIHVIDKYELKYLLNIIEHLNI